MDEDLSPDWTRDEVEAQLAKILLDPEFARNKSVSRFLKFVVEETLDGRGARLKAFTVGVAVFSRDETFDAQNSSIVRVQAARLRQLLEFYYAGNGAKDPIRIKMPLGGYRVSFDKTARDVLRAPDAGEPPPSGACKVAPLDPIEPDPSHARWRRPDWRLAAFAVAVLVGLLFASDLLLWQRTERLAQSARTHWMTVQPTLAVKRGDHSSPDADPAVEKLSDVVERALSAFDGAVVTRRTSIVAQVSQNAYVLDIDAAPARPGRVNLAFKLFHAHSGVLVWAKDFANALISDGFEEIGSAVSQAIGDTNGAVNLDMAVRTKPWPDLPTGYVCILASLEAIRDRTPEQLKRATDCLEADVTANSEQAFEEGLLAAVLVRRYLDASPGGRGRDDLRRALLLARHSFDHDPQRARSAFILFLTWFYDKRFEEAFVAARKALEINPNASLFAAQIGASHISRGDYARGEKLLEPMVRLDQAPPSFFAAFLCLAAFMRGDEEKFQRLAGAANMENSEIGLILQIIAFHRVHEVQSGTRAARILREKFPGVAENIPAALDRNALAPEIVARLTAELRIVESTRAD